VEKTWNYDGLRLTKPGRGKPIFDFGYLTVPCGGQIDVCCIADGIWVGLHWADGRHHLCRGNADACPWCKTGLPFRPHGYYPVVVVSHQKRGQSVMHVTDSMAIECPTIKLDGQRGACFTFVAAKKKRGRCSIKPAGFLNESDILSLPRPNDLPEFLRRTMQ